MGPYLLAILFLAIPPHVMSPSLESGVRSQPEKGTETQRVNGIIREVRFVGLKRIFSEALQEHINSRVGDPLIQRTVERDVRALANLGWFDFVSAEVVPITDSLARDEASDLRLVFKLEERPYLSKIIFHGSEVLSRERILQLLAERKIMLNVSAPLDRVELSRASRCIKGELQTLGHPQANVHVVLEEVSTATVSARFEIADGPQVSVTQVTFSGNQAVPQKLLERQMRQVAPKAHFARLRHKNIYTEERLQQDLERITEYYRNHGYAEARIGTPVVERDYVVGQHMMLFRHQHLSRQPFDPKKLRSGLERLVRTGYVRSFEPEDIRTQFDEARHSVDVSIRVTEVGQQKISLTGGWNNLGGTIGAAYSVFNLLGGEELIDSHIDVGPDSLHLALRIAEESLFGSRVTASLTVFQDVVRPHLPGVLGNRHFLSTRNAGFAVGWGYPLSSNETLTTNYTISHQTTQYAVELPPSLTGLVGNQIGSSTSIHSFGADWVGGNNSQHWDIGPSVSGGRLGGDENLVRSSVEYDRIRRDPLTNGRNSWVFRSYAAGVSSFRGDLLFQNRYFTGDELLRGFRRGEMSPYSLEDLTDSSGKDSFQAIPTGADLLVAMNAEYRVPVAPRTQVVGFYDTGSGWLLPNWLGPGHPALLSGTNGILRASTGFEVRWQIPAVEQPLRLDLAINPLRLAKSFLLPDGSRFRAPDRLLGWTWGLGPLF